MGELLPGIEVFFTQKAFFHLSLEQTAPISGSQGRYRGGFPAGWVDSSTLLWFQACPYGSAGLGDGRGLVVTWPQSPTEGEKTRPREPSILLVSPEQHQGMTHSQILFFLCPREFGASLRGRYPPIAPVGFKDHLDCNSTERMHLLPPHVFSPCRH